jgi:hypothetical protein
MSTVVNCYISRRKNILIKKKRLYLFSYLANVKKATAISLTAVSGYPLDLNNGFTLSKNLLVNIPLLTSCVDNDVFKL